jgi:hypothetical protein
MEVSSLRMYVLIPGVGEGTEGRGGTRAGVGGHSSCTYYSNSIASLNQPMDLFTR